MYLKVRHDATNDEEHFPCCRIRKDVYIAFAILCHGMYHDSDRVLYGIRFHAFRLCEIAYNTNPTSSMSLATEPI